MKRNVLLLLAPTTYRASDFVRAAEKADVNLVVATDTPQALEGLAPRTQVTLPFHRPQEAARQARLFHAATPLHGVLAADDAGAPAAAAVAAALGLRGSLPAAVSDALDKGRMRSRLAAHGVAQPAFHPVHGAEDLQRAAEVCGFPCVLKPSALSASTGVMRADDQGQLAERYLRLTALLRRPELAKRQQGAAAPALVEAFVPGAEVALEGLVEDGELRLLALFDKPDALDGPFFEETIYVTPSRLQVHLRRDLLRTAGAAAAALGLEEGAVHAELRLGAEGPVLIEIAPRSIGGLCARTLRFGTGRSLEEILLRRAAGLPLPDLRRERKAAGVMMIPIPAEGLLEGVDGCDAARTVEGVREVVLTIPVGERVVPLPDGNRYLGFILARGEEPARVEEALRQAHGRMRFRIRS